MRIENETSLLAKSDLNDLFEENYPSIDEQTKKIEKTRPEMTSGSGITTDEAAEIIEELETRQMVAISKLVYEIVDNTRETMVTSGLEPSERIDAWKNLYDRIIS